MMVQVVKWVTWLVLLRTHQSYATEAPSEAPSQENVPRARSRTKIPEGVKNIVSGVVGGVAFVYGGQPLDKIKTLLQTSQGEYEGALDCLRKTVRMHGLRGLYAGATATLAAEVSSNAIHYSSFQAVKSALMEKEVPEPLAVLLAGCAAGALVSAIYTPLDLLKIRLQTQSQGQVSLLQCPLTDAPLIVSRGSGLCPKGCPR